MSNSSKPSATELANFIVAANEIERKNFLSVYDSAMAMYAGDRIAALNQLVLYAEKAYIASQT